MRCSYITSLSEKDQYSLFISRLGERCQISQDEMNYIELSQYSPVSPDVWEAVDSGEYAIIDIRKVNTAIAMVLYARYLKRPGRTFLILAPEREEEFDWGYGCAFCRLQMDEAERGRKLIKLQRDIAFFFSMEKEKKNDLEKEPVREFLEKYWKKEQFQEEGIDFKKIEYLESNMGEAIVERLKSCL